MPLISPENLVLFMLVLARVSGIVVLGPFFSNVAAPIAVRAMLTLLITLMLVVSGVPMGAELQLAPLWLCLSLAKEFAVGAAIGLTIRLLFTAIQLAGQIIGFQMGFLIAQIIDPLTNVQSPVMTQLYNFIALLVFFAFNGHHYILMALTGSFELVPLGEMALSDGALSIMMTSAAAIFSTAVRIAAPVWAALFLVNCGMAIVTRSVPQINVFIMGFTLTIGVGLLATMLSLPHFGALVRGEFEVVVGQAFRLMRAL